jgi:hypothetical protein
MMYSTIIYSAGSARFPFDRDIVILVPSRKRVGGLLFDNQTPDMKTMTSLSNRWLCSFHIVGPPLDLLAASPRTINRIKIMRSKEVDGDTFQRIISWHKFRPLSVVLNAYQSIRLHISVQRGLRLKTMALK